MKFELKPKYRHLVQKRYLCGPTCIQMVILRRNLGWIDQEKIAERRYYERLRREASNISYGAEIGRHRAKEQMDSEKRQPYNHNPFSQGYMGKEINKFFGKKKR